MSLRRIRSAAAILAAAGTLLALTACAPPVHHVPTPGAASTSKPRITPAHTTAPTTTGKPASDYSFTCSDVVHSQALPSLYSVAMKALTGAQFERVNQDSGMPFNYYVEEMGGLDCAWYDGKASNDGATAATSTHDMELTILPVDSSVWTKFLASAEPTPTTGAYVECSSDSGYNSCQYDNFVNGSWYELDTNNMSPVPPSETTLPAPVQAIVTAVNAKLSAGAPAQTNAVQHGTRPLPGEPQELITASQVRLALGLPATAAVSIDCTGEGDGPWTIEGQAAVDTWGGTVCNFDTPDGGTYGGYNALAGGAWAAHDAEANTPGETAPLTLNQPETSSIYTFADTQGGHTVDLIFDGSWVSIYLFAPDSSETQGANSASDALIGLAQAAENTIG